MVEAKTAVSTAMEVVALTEPPTLLTYTGWDDNQQKYLERIVVVVHLWEVSEPQ